MIYNTWISFRCFHFSRFFHFQTLSLDYLHKNKQKTRNNVINKTEFQERKKDLSKRKEYKKTVSKSGEGDTRKKK